MQMDSIIIMSLIYRIEKIFKNKRLLIKSSDIITLYYPMLPNTITVKGIRKNNKETNSDFHLDI